ncbi:hypothetical protein CDL15_Pgr012406 [Punica granatum]|uniref:Uncharacterized protein n=1 Tax=Punica granatum TaxID=22663 RepID=A0A218WYB2_PUNGR|nr:hypothetical protein CDL15_Pgr012406 [Punica granatum]
MALLSCSSFFSMVAPPTVRESWTIHFSIGFEGLLKSHELLSILTRERYKSQLSGMFRALFSNINTCLDDDNAE